VWTLGFVPLSPPRCRLSDRAEYYLATRDSLADCCCAFRIRSAFCAKLRYDATLFSLNVLNGTSSESARGSCLGAQLARGTKRYNMTRTGASNVRVCHLPIEPPQRWSLIRAARSFPMRMSRSGTTPRAPANPQNRLLVTENLCASPSSCVGSDRILRVALDGEVQTLFEHGSDISFAASSPDVRTSQS
jgi:hypothetical protein